MSADDEREALVRKATTPDGRLEYHLLEGEAVTMYPYWAADLRTVLAGYRRHRGPITDADALRFGKIAWVAYQGDKEWARSVVDDCFSPADDLPEEALDMIAVARAVLESAGTAS